ncbi:nucleotidyl transferase AbiEii/AbiGii toxin family protein [uncultured Erythrobacter sp.]|uniref:nucleotidyl transferase AbiEii/AbiGii toxin family protein n=1 Tax=uncultured Erythrobacter sp. TaxID=263913 RepID=UPI00261F2F69|nr:nucleotidyl transferase AbiEii/AbiGii toxin family protein [uncultured Erythrobacter sp.]
MLTVDELRNVARRSGARDIGNVEIDILLTHILQLFHERDLLKHLAFKGGTMLRKMVFGPRGRLSTDLDFTRNSDIDGDDLLLEIAEVLVEAPYHGITFAFDRDKDWYHIEDGLSANPLCTHDANKNGVRIKVQISTREQPILPVIPIPQLPQDYFKLLPFDPVDIPCLAYEEITSEKVRAASQRTKIRDLHDLSEIAKRPIDQDTVRALAVLKLWAVGDRLHFESFCERINDADYDVEDLRMLLRKDESPSPPDLVKNVTDRFRFLQNLGEEEAILVEDTRRQLRREAAHLQERLQTPKDDG